MRSPIWASESRPLKVGIWPAGVTPPDGATLAVLRERLGGWQLKALREA